MPTQAVQTEEENLIILDDIVEENTSPEIKIEETILSEEIIDFGSNEESLVEEKKIETSNIDSDIGFDLGDFGTDTSKQDETNASEEIKKPAIEDDIEENNIGFGDIQGSTGSFIGEEDKTSDLNSILDETIMKLQSRADIIAEDKSIEQSNIKDFKSQISDLESNVSNSESIVSDLNKESVKIKSNIKSLERMKMKDEIAETKKEISAKVHNSKRSR